jgi:hypothetical protein
MSGRQTVGFRVNKHEMTRVCWLSQVTVVAAACSVSPFWRSRYASISFFRDSFNGPCIKPKPVELHWPSPAIPRLGAKPVHEFIPHQRSCACLRRFNHECDAEQTARPLEHPPPSTCALIAHPLRHSPHHWASIRDSQPGARSTTSSIPRVRASRPPRHLDRGRDRFSRNRHHGLQRINKRPRAPRRGLALGQLAELVAPPEPVQLRPPIPQLEQRPRRQRLRRK